MEDKKLTETFQKQVESVLADLSVFCDSLRSALCDAGITEIDFAAPTGKDSFILESYDHVDSRACPPYVEAGFAFLLNARPLSADEYVPNGPKNWLQYKGALVMVRIHKELGPDTTDAVLSYSGGSRFVGISPLCSRNNFVHSTLEHGGVNVGKAYLNSEKQQFLESFAAAVLRLGGPDIASSLTSIVSVDSSNVSIARGRMSIPGQSL